MDKIRKLLALADKNSGASENEMMTAMAMAQALMRRHHLTRSQVRRLTAQHQPGLNSAGCLICGACQPPCRQCSRIRWRRDEPAVVFPGQAVGHARKMGVHKQ